MRQQASSDSLSRRHRIGVLLICAMSLFIVGLDITAVNVALPAIEHELHAGISGLQWTVSAYTVVMASLLIEMPNTAPHTPTAWARSRGSVNVLTMIDIATGFSIDAPTACSTRNATSSSTLVR